jgi:hypothetical protein
MERIRVLGRLLRPLLIALSGVGVLGVVIAATPLFFHPSGPSLGAIRTMLAGLPGRYEPAGRYVGPSSALLEPKTVKRAGGVPWVDYAGLGARPNPTVVAQFGLLAYGRWLRSHRPRDRAEVVRIADWLVRHQQRDGQWDYGFDFSWSGGRVSAQLGSSMAQGQAMSLLERAYRVTRRGVYLAAAVRALQPLEAPLTDGGLERCYRSSCRMRFFEEYPTRPPSDVLNGFMFTLVGLYDLASVAPGSRAMALYQAGRRTLHLVLPRYDSHGIGRYCLSSPQIADRLHEALQIFLLRALNSLAPDHRLVFYADRWTVNLDQAPA